VGTTTAPAKVWWFGGIFSVRSKARCAIHTQLESDWSPTLTVQVDVIYGPITLTSDLPNGGVGPGVVNTDYTFSSSGAYTSLGDAVEYQFDWGDGSLSLWIAPDASGTANAKHKFAAAGPYTLSARARSKTTTTLMSGWTVTLSVSILGAPSTIAATGGTLQSTLINTAFPVPLQATVRDNNNNPLPGVTVTFTAPGSGAGGTFPSGNTAVTNASGQASVPFTANGTAGSYTVTANVTPALATPASFPLTNN